MTFSPGAFIRTKTPQTATRFLFAYSPYHFAAPQCMFSQVHFFFELFISPFFFIGFIYVAQAFLQLMSLLFQYPLCWDYPRVPQQLALELVPPYICLY